MNNTRGNLKPATIYESSEEGDKIGSEVFCMFNPFEYTLSKSNQYAEDSQNQENTPQMSFKKAGAQTLKLSLMFDTYEEGTDVSLETEKLWKFMKPKEPTADESNPDKKEPPRVAFSWGQFVFVAVITQMTQKYTLFDIHGIPLRAKVDVTFTQHDDRDDYIRGQRQNPTSGGGPILKAWQVTRGDRIDMIASEVYGDATKWKHIAEFNEINNPHALTPGSQLLIPDIDEL